MKYDTQESLFDNWVDDVLEEKKFRSEVEKQPTCLECAQPVANLQRQIHTKTIGRRSSAAYIELGGGIGSMDETTDIWDESILSCKPNYFEAKRAFEQFNLLSLTAESISTMTSDEKVHLALHFRKLYEQIENRIRVLRVEESYTIPTFEHYDFKSNAEAHEYSIYLGNFRSQLHMSSMWNALQKINTGKRDVSRDIRRHYGREPFVVKNPQDGSLHLQYKDASEFRAA